LASGGGADGFDGVFGTALSNLSAELRTIAANDLLREALTWQNPEAIALPDALLRADEGAPQNRKQRYRERQLARLWQRYCAKTEMIGFFGPTLWVTFDPDQAATTAKPGPELIDRRRVFLEPWALTVFGITRRTTNASSDGFIR
jgi:hypothetical protein